uniref:Protein kinase domain-containing protein n=1 Tax=Oryzias latipes TaxID=8090 RepID=A0A3P9JEJ5_ORYLA
MLPDEPDDVLLGLRQVLLLPGARSALRRGAVVDGGAAVVDGGQRSVEVSQGFILLGRKGVYKVEKFLGEGSYGKVAKCKKLGTDQVVAIKIIWGSGQMEINALEELSQINADDHNLVKFVESFKYKKYTCIAFEVLDQSLLDFMEKRDFHPLTVEEIRTIAWQLIVALKGLNSVNLVHCDIKLDNIMLVDQVSEPFRVKLIDFGLAEKIGHMRTGATMQNICYRAPEVILGLPLDQSVDLWTVGYILFVLYTGSFIHGWDADYNILRAMVKMQGMPEEKVLNQGQSKKKGRLFVDLLKRMLMVDPRKRISPSEALQHPFFAMGRVQPTAGTQTTNPEEPPAVEVHLQPEAKEVTNTPQRPAAVSQECPSMKKKPGRIQQQRETIREHLIECGFVGSWLLSRSQGSPAAPGVLYVSCIMYCQKLQALVMVCLL